MRHDRSKSLYERATRIIPGGVSSQIRTLEAADKPLFFTHAKGSRMWDVDGNQYIDYVMGMGPNLFGHAPDFLNRRVAADLEQGMVFAAQFERELEVAEMALGMIPMADAMARFASSGTEIDQLALRLMRGYTGRPKYIKFEGHYHGWLDSVSFSVHPSLNEAGAADRPTPVAESQGMDPASATNIVVCEWNDLSRLEQAFAAHPGQIAGVIMEPILGNSNAIVPRPGYLEGVKALCAREGALLCFDEVITGFRVAAGGAQEMLGVTPDIATYAKALAGGFPLSMIVGRREVMQLLADGTVFHGGSFNSNVMSIAAAYATLEHIQQAGEAFYTQLNGRGLTLMQGLREIAAACNSDLHVQGPGAFFGISFTTRSSIHDWRDHARHCDEARYNRFAHEMLKEGVRLSTSGRAHMASTHTDEDVEQTLAATRRVLQRMDDSG